MRHTPLHRVHTAHDAKMVEFGGWHMPVQYGPILDEVRHVRTRCGLFDLSHMGRVELRGPGASAFVDRVATCFCARIPVTAIRYGLLCREDGNPLDDVLVYRGDPDVFVVVNAANTASDLEWLRAHAAGFDVEIADVTDDLGMLALQGPASQTILQHLVEGFDLAELKYYRFGFGRVAGVDNVRISRTGYTGENGFELYFPAGESERFWNELLRVGEPDGLRPIGLGARDTLRLEAGMPLYGHEIDLEHNPIEAGLSFGVSFAEEKGDWIGRAALAAVKEHPTRKLVGLTTEGKRVPRQGYELYHAGAVVGAICSGSISPTIDTKIATAYLPLELADVGTEVEMDVRGKRQPCTVVELPFYSRTRK